MKSNIKLRAASSKFQGLTRIEVAIITTIVIIVVAVLFVSMRLAQQDARNASRLSEIRQVITALELFRNDNGRYPNVLGGKPTGGSPAFDTYLVWPAAPNPADGPCTPAQNSYVYAPIGSPPSSYTLTFCLGRSTDGVAAGVRTATPKGIK